MTLVFPEDADLAAGRISVLVPIGTAVLGYRRGDMVAWPVRAGAARFSVEEVPYQPEASGDPDL